MHKILKISPIVFSLTVLMTATNLKAQQVKSPNAVYVIAKEYGTGETVVSPPFSGNCNKMFSGKANIIGEYQQKYSKNYGKTLANVEVKGPYASWDDVWKIYGEDLKSLEKAKPVIFELRCNLGKQ